jgi:hypothetical protein
LTGLLPCEPRLFFKGSYLRDRGNFYNDKMPGYHLLDPAAATALQFAAC